MNSRLRGLKFAPVVERNPVATPVVEVLVTNHALDAFIVCVGRSFRRRENKPGIEYIKRLVFHRAHIKVVDNHDVEHVKVVDAPPPPLVPLESSLQARERPPGLVLVVLLGPYLECDVAAVWPLVCPDLFRG